MASGKVKCTGSFIGTGAAKEIALDFTPRHVEIVNVTDLEKAEMFEEMGNLSGKEEGVSTDVTGAITGLTTDAGIVLGHYKFTVGTDNSVNGLGDHLVWKATE